MTITPSEPEWCRVFRRRLGELDRRLVTSEPGNRFARLRLGLTAPSIVAKTRLPISGRLEQKEPVGFLPQQVFEIRNRLRQSLRVAPPAGPRRGAAAPGRCPDSAASDHHAAKTSRRL